MSFSLGEYDQATLAIMTRALDEACQDRASNDPVAVRAARSVMARRIMMAVDAGERDNGRLKDSAQRD
jgi:hypothetical protein